MFKLAVLSTVKNESQDIAEWVSFHLLQGIEHFFLFDNCSNDNTLSELSRFPSSVVTVVRWPVQPGQSAAFQYALRAFKGKTQWMAFIDADEFLFSPKGKDLRDVLNEYDKFSGVAPHWVTYGSNGVDDKKDRLVIESFTGRAKDDFSVNRHVKSVVKLDEIQAVTRSPHIFNTTRGVVNEKKQILPPEKAGIDDNISFKKLRINHYVVKDKASWERKKNRGYSERPAGWRENFWAGHDRNEVVDNTLVPYTKPVREVFKLLSPADGQFSAQVVSQQPPVIHFNPAEYSRFYAGLLPLLNNSSTAKSRLEALTNLPAPVCSEIEPVASENVFFIHIPKTAGTSFRNAAETWLGRDACVFDYGLNEKSTDALVSDLLYKEKDFFTFNQTVSEKNPKFLCGHVHANKYIRTFGARNTVTVFRDPVQRIKSEYLHFVRVNGYEGDFKSFFEKPQFINRQTKMMAGVPVKALGLLGVTESYADFLQMFNRLYGHNLLHKSDNLSSAQPLTEHPISDDDLARIRSLNKDDIEFYDQAKAIYQERFNRFNAGLPYAHGQVVSVTPDRLTGWCWWFDSDKPVDLQILVNGRDVARVKANEFRPGLLQFGVPRDGYVGFSCQYQLSDGDQIQVVTCDDAQVIHDGYVHFD